MENLTIFCCKDSEDRDCIFIGCSDIKSAFRLLPLKKSCWKWLIMMAKDPESKNWQFFIDKCFPFGASISCSHFQHYSNVLKHLIQYRTTMNSINNYLDDFLFVAATVILCNFLVQEFLTMCNELGIPIFMEKMEWAAIRIIFLGILLDGRTMNLIIPEDKRIRAVNMIQALLNHKKARVNEIQSLCGFLNFLNKAVLLGRAFTHHMYAKFSKSIDLSRVGLYRKNGKAVQQATKGMLKPHHHIRLDSEFKFDCHIWLQFLTNEQLRKTVCRPMLDVKDKVNSREIGFYSDTSKAVLKGFGCIFGKNWICGQWPAKFIKECDLSIEYLELFAMVAGLLTWQKQLSNMNIVVHCDNQAVVQMVNNITPGCTKCMRLIRIVVLNGLIHNRRVRAKFVRTQDNGIADSLSRLEFTRFRKLAPHMRQFPHSIDNRIWPVDQLFKCDAFALQLDV